MTIVLIIVMMTMSNESCLRLQAQLAARAAANPKYDVRNVCSNTHMR